MISTPKPRTAIERTQTPIVLAVRSFSRGLRLICNFVGALKALRSLSFPLVHDANQPTRGILETLVFAPVLSSVPVLHASQESMEKAAWRPEKFRIKSRKSQ